MPNILDDILNYNLNFIKCYLGDYGLGLRRFAEDVNHSHPDSTNIIGTNNSKKICDYIKIVKYCIKQNLDLDLLNKSFLNDFKKIDSPFFNKENIRLIKNRKDRNLLRKSKNTTNLNINNFYKKNWNNVPDSFEIYSSKHIFFKNKEIEKAQAIADRYKSQNCPELFSNIQKSINSFFYNFNKIQNYIKISPNIAAAVLAKFCDLEYDEVHYKPKMYPLYFFDEEFLKVENFENFYGLDQSLFDDYFVLSDKSCYKKQQKIGVLLGERSKQYYFISIFYF